MSTEITQKIDLIMKMGESLHKNGASAFRIETAMKKAAGLIHLRGEFFFTPTYMFGAFKTDEGEISRHIRIEPGKINLDKLCSVDEVADDYLSGKISYHETDKLLDEIDNSVSKFHPLVKIICFGLASAGIAQFLFSEVYNVFGAFSIGLIVGIVTVFTQHIVKLDNIFEVIVAFFATIIAYLFALLFPQLHFSVILLSGLIVLIPGLSLTEAIAELARNHLASGTARFMGAIMSLLKFSFGVALGLKVAGIAGDITPPIDGIILPSYFNWIAVLVTGCSFTVLFDARLKDMGWILISSFVGFLSSFLGNTFLGSEVGPFIGGFCIGALSNALARYHKRPASLTIIPGIILLVPGSIGYKSFSMMFDKNIIQGVESSFSMIVVALSIVTGLLIGSTLIDPKKTL